MFGASNASNFDLHPAENAFFGFVAAQVAMRDRSFLKEVVGGAYVEFDDIEGSGGRCGYNFLTGLEGNYQRVSSHSSTTQQYGLPQGKVIGSVLIGTKNNNVTWFQLEGAGWNIRNPVGAFKHALDTILYVVLRRQMGPLGTSDHLESNPLTSKSASPMSAACSSMTCPATTLAPALAATPTNASIAAA
jgi:hypothetical protein